jgi:site-specific DNA recombinase
MNVISTQSEPTITSARPRQQTEGRKRAVLLLRVSSRGQVNTDYDEEGLSIPAQRQAGERKAGQLDADVVREYVEPGFSGKSLVGRPTFRKLIEDIRQLEDVDYVIVWSISRWARNQEDHWTARGLINRAGAKLISVKEPIGDDSSYGVTIEGVMAAVSAGRRIEISEEVTRGVRRKIEVGGTHGRAAVGYLNVREPLPQGGEVRTVALDPDRAPLIAWAFETYATGLYSTVDMVVLLEAMGLRTRPTPKRPSKPLGLSVVQWMLANPYYTGKIRHMGKVYEGRHEPLISEELFDKVQSVLAAHKLSGERDRKHGHYLKGSIYCGMCGRRLTYSRNKGNGGIYEYFLCAANQRHQCSQPAQRVDHVEAAIERHHATVRLSEAERSRVQAAVEDHLAKLTGVSGQEIARCNSVLSSLKMQERKLLEAHYADEISKELFSEEQARIKRERSDTEAIVARLTVDHDDLQAALALALRLATYDLQDLYLRASPQIRRLMNQALFEFIWICHDDVAGSQLASPFYELHALGDTTRHATTAATGRVPTGVGVGAAEDAKASGSREPEALDGGSITTKLVELVGLEPTTFALPARRSPS